MALSLRNSQGEGLEPRLLIAVFFSPYHNMLILNEYNDFTFNQQQPFNYHEH